MIINEADRLTPEEELSIVLFKARVRRQLKKRVDIEEKLAYLTGCTMELVSEIGNGDCHINEWEHLDNFVFETRQEILKERNKMKEKNRRN